MKTLLQSTSKKKKKTQNKHIRADLLSIKSTLCFDSRIRRYFIKLVYIR